MNMILAGDGHSNIHKKDSLANPTYADKISYDKDGNEVREKMEMLNCRQITADYMI